MRRERRRTIAGRGCRTSSFIRTVTVGSGIGPDLLTLRRSPEALAGSRGRPLRAGPRLPPVGSSAPP